MTDDAFKVSRNADGTEPLLLTKMLNLSIDTIRVHVANRNYHGGRIKKVAFDLMVEVFKSTTYAENFYGPHRRIKLSFKRNDDIR